MRRAYQNPGRTRGTAPDAHQNRAGSIVSAEVDGGIVLLDVEAGTFFGLDEVGSAIWRQLVQDASEDDIVCALLDEYDVDALQLRADVRAFLDLLRGKGLAERDDGTAGR